MDLLEEPKNLMESGDGETREFPIAETRFLKLKEDCCCCCCCCRCCCCCSYSFSTLYTRWWQLTYFLYVHPEKKGKVSILTRSYFSKGVGEKPPTRDCCCWVTFLGELLRINVFETCWSFIRIHSDFWRSDTCMHLIWSKYYDVIGDGRHP